jgi:ParB family chromosome partitioning protein
MDGEENITEIDIELLQPNPSQPRGLITPESLVDLVDSIREHGILEPLVVAKTPAGYQIIAGERRWRAARMAGFKMVPVIIKDTTPQGMLEMALVENIQRQDLNPLERALAFKKFIDDFGYSTSDIAFKIGKSQSFVSNSLRLLTLPDALKDGLASGTTTEGHVRALAALEDHQLIVEAYKEVLQKNLSVRGAEELTRRLKERAKIPRRGYSERGYIRTKELEKMEDDLEEKFLKLGARTQAKVLQSRILLKVSLVLVGSQNTTTPLLHKIFQKLSEV